MIRQSTFIFLFAILSIDLTSSAQQKFANTLSGKVICGYQGWFNCYGDGSPVNGWRHWSGGRPDSDIKQPSPGNITFEIYPDISEYDPLSLFQTGLGQFGDGTPARLFSSIKSDVIDLHFLWMKKYGIDGVALQRFLGETKNRLYREQRDSIMLKVMRSSQKYDRIFYLMYDLNANDTAFFQNDFLHIEKDLHPFGLPNYATERGKPVVCLWGFGFTHRLNAPEASLTIINWLKRKGYYVIGGVPTNWLSGTIDSYSNYLSVYRAFDMISPWSVGRFKNKQEADHFAENYLQAEQEYCKAHNIGYQPVAFPGFAWSNWNGEQPNQIARNKGDFFWQQVYNIKKSGAENLYVAMFDEYDEGTAIAKIADSYFSVPGNQYFLTSSADGTYVSSDFYLRLTGKATQVVKNEIPLTIHHEVPLQAPPIWFRTSFESGLDAMPLFEPKTNEPVSFEITGDQAASGKTSLKINGYAGTLSTSEITIFEVHIPVSEKTKMTYRIFPENIAAQFIYIDLLTTDGSKLNLQRPATQVNLNEWNTIEVHLANWLRGKTISKLLIGSTVALKENFTCFIDNISIFEPVSDK